MKILNHFSKVIFPIIILFCISCSHYKIKENSEKIFREDNTKATIAEITENRDISQYDEGGLFYCNRLFDESMNEGKLGEKKVFDFLSKHLSEKKRGYIKLSCNETDTLVTSHIFVEPDLKNEWKIKVRIVSYHLMNDTNSNNGNNIFGDFEYASVECIEDKL